MKKRFAVLFVVIMGLTVAAPSLAYTSHSPISDKDAYTVSIKMVEHDSNGDIFVDFLSSKPANRGYAKHEIVSAIGEITVPANVDLLDNGYTTLRFSGKNITFKVTDNDRQSGDTYKLGSNINRAGWNDAKWAATKSENRLELKLTVATGSNHIPSAGNATTYRFLAFAKITGFDASLTFELVKNDEFLAVASGSGGPKWGADPFGHNNIAKEFLEFKSNYIVAKGQDSNYYIFDNGDENIVTSTNGPDKLIMRIDIKKGSRGVTEGLHIYPDGALGVAFGVHVEPSSKELIFILEKGLFHYAPEMIVGDQVKLDTYAYRYLKSFYTEHFEEALGLTAYHIGNLLTDEYWREMAGSMNIFDTVDLVPYTDYVAIN